MEIAASVEDDEGACTARVLARAELPDRMVGWALYRLAEVPEEVDSLLAGVTRPDGAPSGALNLLVHADVSHRIQDTGLSVDPFPGGVVSLFVFSYGRSSPVSSSSPLRVSTSERPIHLSSLGDRVSVTLLSCDLHRRPVGGVVFVVSQIV